MNAKFFMLQFKHIYSISATAASSEWKTLLAKYKMSLILHFLLSKVEPSLR